MDQMDPQRTSKNLTINASGALEHSECSRIRIRARVRGLVQGVGFRPHVYVLALQCQLSGWVQNDGEGVLLEVEGERSCVENFIKRLVDQAPPLSRIDSVETTEVPSSAEADGSAAPKSGFVIIESGTTAVTTAIIPDAATCSACLAESMNIEDARYDYSFLNCTHCGPRYTITKQLPYDRKQTSMAIFPMCDLCEKEYRDPLNRRFHAQPTACPKCGPQLSEPVERIVERLRAGEIVAIKGLGGFHLACDATNETAVATLRERKNREAKPFAIMVANVKTAARLVDISPAAEKLLAGSVRPIVLLPKKIDARFAETESRLASQVETELAAQLAPSLAPGMNSLGVMLPYTPLQHLIFHAAAARPDFNAYKAEFNSLILVMTSANPGGEPLVVGNTEAHERLANIADAVVTHNRDIVIRVDDSVVAMVHDVPFFIRRARGYVPEAIKLPKSVPSILSFGADLKNTICVTRGNEAFVSQHIGDLDNVSTVDFLKETAEHLLSILEVKPEVVSCDLHPDFQSTRLAEQWGAPVIKVQHHHAHIASVAAEYGHQGPLLGVALDGFGLGTDGLLWGGELLHVSGARFSRVGNFAPLAQPGGDRAAREPWRMAAAALHAMGRSSEISTRFADIPHAQHLAAMLSAGINCFPTTSAGRLFDAASGLARLRDHANFEGEAPMLLESLVRELHVKHDGWSINSKNEISWLPLLSAIADTTSPTHAASMFHGTLVAGLSQWISATAKNLGITEIAFAGGCFLNNILVTNLSKELEQQGFRVLIPRKLPPNDGGISLGQAWVAALLHN
jgi:hydrogenase maturation protein HypF